MPSRLTAGFLPVAVLIVAIVAAVAAPGRAWAASGGQEQCRQDVLARLGEIEIVEALGWRLGHVDASERQAYEAQIVPDLRAMRAELDANPQACATRRSQLDPILARVKGYAELPEPVLACNVASLVELSRIQELYAGALKAGRVDDVLRQQYATAARDLGTVRQQLDRGVMPPQSCKVFQSRVQALGMLLQKIAPAQAGQPAAPQSFAECKPRALADIIEMESAFEQARSEGRVSPAGATAWRRESMSQLRDLREMLQATNQGDCDYTLNAVARHRRVLEERVLRP